MQALANDISTAEKKKTIIVYGRPQIKRNCYSILEKGLAHWANMYGQDSEWKIVSVGTKHADVTLAGNKKIESLGKLSLESYANILRESAIGISLMCSPHPSYPPLEMAHFGIRVITNRYANKAPSTRHENIITLPNSLPLTLAKTLQQICSEFEKDPGRGLRGQTYMPNYYSDAPFECLDDVAGEINELLRL